jgi:radical S-adenosyl methionine domain-containing protein 2
MRLTISNHSGGRYVATCLRRRCPVLADVLWQVLQVLLLEGENTGPNALRNAEDLVISHEQFQAFLDRHASQKEQNRLVPEDNEAMENSYLLLDEEMRYAICIPL